MTSPWAFRRLWLATGVSSVGDGIRRAVLPLVATTQTHSPVSVALITSISTAPWLLLAVPIGVVVDRLDRRKAMTVAQLARFLLVAALSAEVLTHRLNLAELYIAAFVVGVGEIFFEVSAQAYIPDVVPEGELLSANSRLYGTELVATEFAGPPLGGVLFGLTPGLPLLIDAFTFFLSGAFLWGVTISNPLRSSAPGNSDSSGKAEWLVGLRWLVQNRSVALLALLAAALNLATGATDAVFVLYCSVDLKLGSEGYGLLLAMAGLGSLIGSAVTSRKSLSLDRNARAIGFSLFVLSVVFILMGLAPSIEVAAVGYLMIGINVTFISVVSRSLRQARIPNHLMGRVDGVGRALAYGALPLGAVLGGLLARSDNLRAPYVAAGILLALMTATWRPHRWLNPSRE